MTDLLGHAALLGLCIAGLALIFLIFTTPWRNR